MASVNPVHTTAQAESFRLTAKKRMLELDLTVRELARRLNLSTVSVSTAINHESMFPGVKERIRKELGL